MERLRQVVRSVLGSESGIYRFVAGAVDASTTVLSDGFGVWRKFQTIRSGADPRGAVTPVRLKALSHPIHLRSGPQDVGAVLNNVIREEYGKHHFLSEPLWLIDAGAYIGDTTAYFLSRYPRLNAIALEPNPSNCEMAVKNLSPYGSRARVLEKGLWGSEETLSFGGEFTAGSIGSGSVQIKTTSIPALLAAYGIPKIDILKMDIEGAEEDVFRKAPEEWLPRIGLLIIETHGTGVHDFVTRTLRDHGFSLRQYRSVWYCVPKA
jgi:FkbM family methyltransferase